MTEAQVKKFMDHFQAKYNRKTKEYKLAVCGEMSIPKDYFKNSKVGRNTLIAILDRIVNAVSDQAGKDAKWIRKNF